MITAQTAWREIPPVSVDVWRAECQRLDSPLLPVVVECHAAAAEFSAIALAFATKESTLGRDESAKRTHNPLGLMLRLGEDGTFVTVKGRRLQVFAGWPQSFGDLADRLRRPPYTETTTIMQLVDLYLMGWVPGAERTPPSGESMASRDLYIKQAVDRLRGYYQEGSPVPPVIYDIHNPADAARFGLDATDVEMLLGYMITNRDGYRPTDIVWHIQDGTTSGSLDWWINGWLNGRKVQASATVMIQKDGSILRVIPEQHGPWTNGEVANPNAMGSRIVSRGGGDPNRVTLSIEAEGRPGNFLTPIQEDAILWQTHDWMKRYGIPKSQVSPHRFIDSVNRPNCPGPYYDKLWPLLLDGGGGGAPSTPVIPEIPWLTVEKLREWWGARVPGYGVSLDGTATKYWIARGLDTGTWPELVSVTGYTGGPAQRIFSWADGHRAYFDGKKMVAVKP